MPVEHGLETKGRYLLASPADFGVLLVSVWELPWGLFVSFNWGLVGAPIKPLEPRGLTGSGLRTTWRVP